MKVLVYVVVVFFIASTLAATHLAIVMTEKKQLLKGKYNKKLAEYIAAVNFYAAHTNDTFAADSEYLKAYDTGKKISELATQKGYTILLAAEITAQIEVFGTVKI